MFTRARQQRSELGPQVAFGEPAATSSSASPCGLEHKQPRPLNTPTTSPHNLTHLALLYHFNNNTLTSLHTTHPPRCSETTTTTTPSHCEPARHSRYISRLRANMLQLPSRPYLPGRICTRSCEAGFSGRRHCQQNPRRARRDQGELAIIHAPKPEHSTNTNLSATQKSSHHTRRRSSPLTPTTASPSPVSPPMPASSPTSCANSPSPRA